MKKLPERLVDLLKEVKLTEASSTWDCHGTPVILHKALEKIAVYKGITFDDMRVIEGAVKEKYAVISVRGHYKDATEESIGEASPYNNKNSYPYAMAEKRAIDRAILKLIGIHGFVYSDDEVDDKFENVKVKKTETKEQPKKKIDDLYITTALDKIKNNKEKKDSTVLRSEMENLKTEIHQSMGWDAFTKTEKFKTFNALKNQILKQKRS